MVLLKDYIYQGKIGNGSFGEIDFYIKDDKEYVVKTMVVGDYLSQVIREIEIYKKLDHPNIVKYIAHKYGSESKLILEKGRCHLGSFISNGAYTGEMYCNWIYQIARAVEYIHSLNIIHTDLKPENIIMFRDENNNFFPKLCDFGCCQIVKRLRSEMICFVQSEWYRSPEIKGYLDKKQHLGVYDFKIDIWSLGVLMVDLWCHQYSSTKLNYYNRDHLTNIERFWQDNTRLSFSVYGDNEPDAQNLINISESLLNITKKLLHHQPNLRTTAAEVVNYLAPYVSESISNREIESQLKERGFFGYPLEHSEVYDMFVNYYKTLDQRIVSDSYFYALKLIKRFPKMNLWRLMQYCLYIQNLLYYDNPPGFSKSIFNLNKREVFFVLNATGFPIF